MIYQHSTVGHERHGEEGAGRNRQAEAGRCRILLAQRQEQEQTISVITQEQARIRENMARLDRNNDLYARYVKKFSEQEDQVEKSRGEIDQLNKQITERQKALDDYLLGLDLG